MDEYIKQNPNKRIFISDARDSSWDNWNVFDSSPSINQYRNILKNYNAFAAVAVRDKIG